MALLGVVLCECGHGGFRKGRPFPEAPLNNQSGWKVGTGKPWRPSSYDPSSGDDCKMGTGVSGVCVCVGACVKTCYDCVA